jgi:hypothetical protein
MRLVILESPFAGHHMDSNVEYARRCMRDCLLRGDAPMASHLLYTQPGVLEDHIPEERMVGIVAGLMWAKHADASVIYIDHGITPGMQAGIDHALETRRKIEYRTLPK